LDVDGHLRLYDDLMHRGVVLRPGFKYGTQWRIYDSAVGEAHAPWLLLPVESAPQTWYAACLSVRLAEGVHKAWICASHDRSGWSYLQVQRWLPGR
jgi:tRNA-intron endonuclease